MPLQINYRRLILRLLCLALSWQQLADMQLLANAQSNWSQVAQAVANTATQGYTALPTPVITQLQKQQMWPGPLPSYINAPVIAGLYTPLAIAMHSLNVIANNPGSTVTNIASGTLYAYNLLFMGATTGPYDTAPASVTTFTAADQPVLSTKVNDPVLLSFFTPTTVFNSDGVTRTYPQLQLDANYFLLKQSDPNFCTDLAVRYGAAQGLAPNTLTADTVWLGAACNILNAESPNGHCCGTNYCNTVTVPTSYQNSKGQTVSWPTNYGLCDQCQPVSADPQAAPTCQFNSCCTGGICNSVTKTCTLPVTVGGVCGVTADCAANLTCDTGLCLLDLGQTCTIGAGAQSNGYCLTELTCNSLNKTCAAPGAAGTPCGIPSDCARDLVCDSVSKTCATPAPAGGACGVTADCATNLTCDTGLCLLDLGQTCTIGTGAQSNGYCLTELTCNSVSKTCAVPAGSGTKCGSATDCAAGLVCNTASQQCAAPGNAGSTCGVAADCISGLLCVDQQCTLNCGAPGVAYGCLDTPNHCCQNDLFCTVNSRTCSTCKGYDTCLTNADCCQDLIVPKATALASPGVALTCVGADPTTNTAGKCLTCLPAGTNCYVLKGLSCCLAPTSMACVANDSTDATSGTGTCQLARTENQSCLVPTDCASGLTCNSSNLCVPAQCQINLGQAGCSADATCCPVAGTPNVQVGCGTITTASISSTAPTCCLQLSATCDETDQLPNHGCCSTVAGPVSCKAGICTAGNTPAEVSGSTVDLAVALSLLGVTLLVVGGTLWWVSRHPAQSDVIIASPVTEQEQADVKAKAGSAERAPAKVAEVLPAGADKTADEVLMSVATETTAAMRTAPPAQRDPAAVKAAVQAQVQAALGEAGVTSPPASVVADATEAVTASVEVALATGAAPLSSATVAAAAENAGTLVEQSQVDAALQTAAAAATAVGDPDVQVDMVIATVPAPTEAGQPPAGSIVVTPVDAKGDPLPEPVLVASPSSPGGEYAQAQAERPATPVTEVLEPKARSVSVGASGAAVVEDDDEDDDEALQGFFTNIAKNMPSETQQLAEFMDKRQSIMDELILAEIPITPKQPFLVVEEVWNPNQIDSNILDQALDKALNSEGAIKRLVSDFMNSGPSNEVSKVNSKIAAGGYSDLQTLFADAPTLKNAVLGVVAAQVNDQIPGFKVKEAPGAQALKKKITSNLLNKWADISLELLQTAQSELEITLLTPGAQRTPQGNNANIKLSSTTFAPSSLGTAKTVGELAQPLLSVTDNAYRTAALINNGSFLADEAIEQLTLLATSETPWSPAAATFTGPSVERESAIQAAYYTDVLTRQTMAIDLVTAPEGE